LCWIDTKPRGLSVVHARALRVEARVNALVTRTHHLRRKLFAKAMDCRITGHPTAAQ
jgi:hypothetical protein